MSGGVELKALCAGVRGAEQRWVCPRIFGMERFLREAVGMDFIDDEAEPRYSRPIDTADSDPSLGAADAI